MSIRQISVQEAHTEQQQGAIYVDVRSQPEFEEGHPAGAVNIPLLDVDERSGQMMPNDQFVQVVQANFPADARLLLGCQVGGRSQHAARILAASGFSNVANVRGGFAGAVDRMSGRVVDEGWVGAGLPVETETPPGASYPELAAKSGS